MKRTHLQEIIRQDNDLKRQCSEYLERYKEEHKERLLYVPDVQAFVDKKTNLIQAYILNDKLFDSYGSLVNLKALDMPKNICSDVWYMIMRFVNGYTLLSMEKVCKDMREAAVWTWNYRGRQIAKVYGPVFDTILQRRKLTYVSFFHMCQTLRWHDTWIPFEVLFRLPVGAAKEYLGKGGPCELIKNRKQTYGVILTTQGHYVGFVKRIKKNTITFFWNTTFATADVDVKNKSRNQLSMNLVLLSCSFPIPSLASHWTEFQNSFVQ